LLKLFDPRRSFGLNEAMDQKAGNQCRAIEQNLTRVAADGHN
jgi:hypothetical protein